ncbi:MAG: helix-turn-helix transcriptional regulator [Firmicutes bacterium]|nr:helix-turn-helix transcriptional regulator [Bacillota bacterium]
MNGIKDSYYRSVMEIASETGLGNLTVRTISARMGVTEAALYRHFPGKEVLLKESYVRAERELWEHFMKTLLINGFSQRSFEEILDTVWKATFDYLQGDPALTVFMHRYRASSLHTRDVQEQSILRSDAFAPVFRIFSGNLGELPDKERAASLDAAMEICLVYINRVLRGDLSRDQSTDDEACRFLSRLLSMRTAACG